MEKRGVSHIEVIFAFLLFISGLIFALYFFSPINSTKVVDSSLSYAAREITDNVTAQVITYSVKINGDQVGGNGLVGVDLVSLPSSYNVRVEKYDGSVLPSKKNGNIVYFNNAVHNWQASDFVFIKLSEDLNPHNNPPDGNPSVKSEDYTISSTQKSNVVSEKRVLVLNNSYYVNYEDIRKSFNLNRIDFGFGLVFGNLDYIKSEKSIPKGREVFSDEKRLEVLRKDGSMAYGNLLVEVW